MPGAMFVGQMEGSSFLEDSERVTSFASVIGETVQATLAEKARTGERASWKRLKSKKVDAAPSEPFARAVEEMSVAVTLEQRGDTTVATAYLVPPEDKVEGAGWQKQKGSRATQFIGALDDLVYGSDPTGARHSGQYESELGEDIEDKIQSLLMAEESEWA